MKALDEIHAGLCDGLTYEEIAEKYPEDFSARDSDKFRYRYRSGEVLTLFLIIVIFRFSHSLRANHNGA